MSFIDRSYILGSLEAGRIYSFTEEQGPWGKNPAVLPLNRMLNNGLFYQVLNLRAYSAFKNRLKCKIPKI